MEIDHDSPVAEWVDPTTLVPWAGNPRINDGKPVDQVAESITRFGFSSPIIARKANNEIIAGHTRWKASRKLGLTLVPVRFLDLSETEAHALALADNKLNELAAWDKEALTRTIAELTNVNDTLSNLGWSEKQLERMIAEPMPDFETPETEQATQTWQIIVDCTDEQQQSELLKDLQSKGLSCNAFTM